MIVQRGLTIGTVLAIGLAAVACGSSGSPSTSGAATPHTAAKLTGTPIRIGMIGSVQSQAISVPDVPKAGRIAVMDINAHGGIHGRPLQLDFCDGQANAQQDGQCAQQLLVQDNDVMLVGESAATGGATLYPVLQKTHKINFADYPVAADDATNPLSYPIVPSTFQLATFPSVMPKGTGTVDVITNTGYQAFVKALVAPGMAAKGYKTNVIAEPQTTVDWSVAASQVSQDGAKYVLLSVAQDKIGAIVNALQQAGVKATTCLVSTSVTDQALSQLAATKAPTLIAAATTSNPSASPMYKQWEADVTKYGQSVGIQDTAGQQVVNAYAAVMLFAQIANKLSTVDSASFQKYLNAQTSFSTGGLTHPIDFSRPGALKGFPRIFNTWNVPAQPTSDGYKVDSGTWLAP